MEINELLTKCMRDKNLYFDSKGIFALVSTNPSKIFTVQDFITKVDNEKTVIKALDGLIRNNYMIKITNGYIIKTGKV